MASERIKYYGCALLGLEKKLLYCNKLDKINALNNLTPNERLKATRLHLKRISVLISGNVPIYNQ